MEIEITYLSWVLNIMPPYRPSRLNNGLQSQTTSRTRANDKSNIDFTVEIVIPAWNEPHTVTGLVKHITKEIQRYKIPIENVWLITHDKATGRAGISADTMGIVRHILVPQEKGGKNASLNAALKKLTADYIIFIDGDIVLKGQRPLYDLIRTIRETNNTSTDPLQASQCLGKNQNRVGAVAGRPATLDSENTMLGFWAHTLTHAAHKLRLISHKYHTPINISGNLYIARREVLPKELPLNVIDDAFMSLWIQKQGYTISYQPKALAYQHYPKTYKDWITQKLRNIAGEKLTIRYFKQHHPEYKPQSMRTFVKEIKYLSFTFERVRSPIHLFWLMLLYLARLHLWLLYFYKIYILKESPKNVWQNWKRVG